MDVLDMMGEGYAMPTSVVPQAASEAPPQAGPSKGQPDILSLLASAARPNVNAAPPTQPDMTGVGPLALLRFASQVTRPRQKGESTAHVAFGAGTDALAQYMAHSQARKTQAQAEDDRKRREAVQDEQLKSARLSTVRSEQQIRTDEEQRPLELKKLKLALESATTAQESAAIELRLKKVKELYAEQAAKAEIEERNARTDQAKAAAATSRAHANLYQRQADELINLAKMRNEAKGAPRNYEYKEGAPGDPMVVHDKSSGRTYQAPMTSVADALSYARREVAAEKEAGLFKGSKQEEESRIRTKMEALMRGTLPADGAAPAPGAPTPPGGPAPAAAPKGGADSPAIAQVKAKSKADPRGMYRHEGRFFVDGQEIDKARAEQLLPGSTGTKRVPDGKPRDSHEPGGHFIDEGN